MPKINDLVPDAPPPPTDRDESQIWRARVLGGDDSEVTFPAWLYVRGYGVLRLLGWDGAPIAWTHWMPCINDAVPIPPRESATEVSMTSGSDRFPAARMPAQATAYSPLRIQILLHAAVSAEPMPSWGEAGASELEDLVRAGAIEEHGPDILAQYRATALGRAWVQALCNVPIPRVVYLDAAGKEIDFR